MRFCAAGVVGVLLIACGGGRHYAVEYELSARTLDGDENRFPPKGAVELLAQARTVAFAPPDECAETSSGRDVARQRCGEVMTALEEAAAEAGFAVVSWQALRGTEPAINYARRNHADVLFEINRLGPDDSSKDIYGSGTLRFSVVADTGHREPVSVIQETQKRCRDALFNAVSVSAGDSSVLLDVKMVSVTSGVTLWNYRRLFTPLRIDGASHGLYYKPKHKPSVRNIAGWAVGAPLLTAGVTFLALGLAVDSKFLGSGVILSAGGAGAVVLAGRPAFEAPDAVLCARVPVPDPFAPVAAAAPSSSADQAHFEGTISGQVSSGERLRRVGRVAASEFIGLLAYLQTVTRTPPRVHLRAPTRPKEVTGQRSTGCDDLANWVRTGSIKQAVYDANCSRSP